MICPVMSPRLDSEGNTIYLKCRKECAWFAGSLEPQEADEAPTRGTCLFWGIFDRLDRIAEK